MYLKHFSSKVHDFNVVFPVVILDLKALYLLLEQIGHNGGSFQLGKRGIEVEFCFICKALRVCLACLLTITFVGWGGG